MTKTREQLEAELEGIQWDLEQLRPVNEVEYEIACHQEEIDELEGELSVREELENKQYDVQSELDKLDETSEPTPDFTTEQVMNSFGGLLASLKEVVEQKDTE